MSEVLGRPVRLGAAAGEAVCAPGCEPVDGLPGPFFCVVFRLDGGGFLGTKARFCLFGLEPSDPLSRLSPVDSCPRFLVCGASSISTPPPISVFRLTRLLEDVASVVASDEGRPRFLFTCGSTDSPSAALGRDGCPRFPGADSAAGTLGVPSLGKERRPRFFGRAASSSSASTPSSRDSFVVPRLLDASPSAFDAFDGRARFRFCFEAPGA
jgi:hypothetical protein